MHAGKGNDGPQHSHGLLALELGARMSSEQGEVVGSEKPPRKSKSAPTLVSRGHALYPSSGKGHPGTTKAPGQKKH